MKINTVLSQNIWFLCVGKSWDEDKNILFRPNKRKTLNMVSLHAGNIPKINTILSQNIWFLWAGKSWDEDKYIISRPNKRKTLTIVFLRAGNISPTFCTRILCC
jgi:hypothetical protein